MTISESVYMYSGLQNAVVYALNAKGRPEAADDGLAYIGREVHATKVYSLTIPASRRVPHVGNDRLLATQIFPSIEPATGELSVGSEDLDLLSILMGTTVKEIAGMKMLPHMTDKQGKEETVGLLLWQAAVSKETKSAGIHFHILPSTKAVPRIPGAGENPIDLIFDIAPNATEYHLHGEALAPLSDPSDPDSGVSETGAFEAGLWSGFSDYPNRIAAFIAQSGQTAFNFPASRRPILTVDADISVWLGNQADDALELVDVADYSVSTTAVTFGVAPGDGKEIQVIYKHR